MRHFSRYLLALCAPLAFVACSGGGDTPAEPTPPPPPPPPAPVASVAIAPADARLIIGTSTQVTATARDAGGTALSRSITWRADNTAIATVSTTGMITAVAIGSTVITATSEGVNGTIAVTVVPVPVASLTINTVGGAFVPREPRPLTVTTRDSAGTVLAGRAITWRSSTDSVVTINSDGIVTARAIGTATVTATSEGRSDSALVTVVEGGYLTASGGFARSTNGAFELTARAASVTAGTALRITRPSTPPSHPRLVPSSAFTVTPDSVLFGQPAMLTMSYAAPSGTALPKQFRIHRWNGTAWVLLESTVDTLTRTVRADAPGSGTFALIEVPRPVLSVTIAPTIIALLRDSSQQLAATARAADGDILTDRAIAWRSSDPTIATVSSNGLVTGITAGGPVTITASSEGREGNASVSVTAPAPSFTKLFTGFLTTCGLRPDGEAWCWGANMACELGVTPCSARSTSAVRVATSLRFAELALGDTFTCGLTPLLVSWCWGDNTNGHLGIGASGNRTAPTLVTGDHRFGSIYTHGEHVCGLRTDSESWCWGANYSGQLGDSDDLRASNRPGRTRGALQFTKLRTGYDHTCGLTTIGQTWCWGDNLDGQIGDGTNVNRLIPVLVSGGHTFVDISLAAYHSCGRTAAGAVWCWGWNGHGQLGDGTRVDKSTPVRVLGSDAFASIHAFGWSTCALLQSGEAKCWGENEEGELGTGDRNDRLTPTSVSGTLRFLTLTSGGGFHVCGRTAGFVWYCWGYNIEGQLGLGTLTDALVPTLLPIPANAAGAAATVSTQRAPASRALKTRKR